jgi:hypothetical protein
MTRFVATAALVLSLASAPLLVGCERQEEKTVSETQVTTEKKDGTTVTEQSKTTQSPDGTVKTTTERQADK